MTSISNLGLTLRQTNSLLSEQSTLSLLSQQLSTGQVNSDLTQYSPTDANNILNFQNAITQRSSFVSSITNVQNRLTTYDTSMTDIESIASQASTLATQNSAYSATSAANIQQTATDYLKQITDDLNQQVGGRYVFAGTRYNTEPVSDLSALTTPPSATVTSGNALPSYDSDYNSATSFTVNSAPSGNFTMGNTTIGWGQMANNSMGQVSVTVGGGSPTTITVPGLIYGTTPADISTNMQLTLNAVAASSSASTAGIPSTLTATTDGNGTVSFDLGGATPNSTTPDAGGTAGETTWVGGATPDGNTAQTPSTSAAAYTADSVLIDTNYSITYGISSDDPSFQKLVNGIRFINSAVTAGKSGDTATYQSDMLQASKLINDGLSGIQTLHAGVANNQNTLTQETTTQNSDITNLQNQLSNIQQVNLSQVGTEINLLQTQLQASYSATATLEKLSLASYL